MRFPFQHQKEETESEAAKSWMKRVKELKLDSHCIIILSVYCRTLFHVVNLFHARKFAIILSDLA